MKFIHIADVHWGMNPDSDRPWSRERAQAIHDSFAEVVRQAKLRDADFLFIVSPSAAPARSKRGQLSLFHDSRCEGCHHRRKP